MFNSHRFRGMPKEEIEIHLVYEGPDVDDGSMSIEDIVPVLQGFSSAYGKIAASDDPDSTHRLRITGVRRGSADIILEVWSLLGSNAAAICAAATVATGVYSIVKKIMGVIALKRHVKKRPYKESISATNSIVVANADNVTIEVPLDLFELFKAGRLDPDMNKMMRPLEKDRIDSAELSAHIPDGTVLRERITAEERPYFDTEEIVATTTRETRLIVSLNALTKSTNSGYAYLSDGSRVFYTYVGDNPKKLHNLFSYPGPLEVSCEAQMDENLKVIRLEIYDLEKTTNDLFSPPSQSNNEKDTDD